jgi:hypothetical protein
MVSAQDVPENLPGVGEVGSNPQNAVQVDLGYLLAGLLGGGFGIGGAYERAFTDQISVKAMGGFITWSLVDATFVDVYGEARYYIWPTGLNGLFVGGGAGLTLVSYSSGTESFSYVWPGILGEVGYKFTFGDDPQSGFFAEPFLGFQGVFGSLDADITYSYGGFNYGVGLGYSF